MKNFKCYKILNGLLNNYKKKACKIFFNYGVSYYLLKFIVRITPKYMKIDEVF